MILDWRAALKAGFATCGGKGFNLARLHRYGFDVPVGGVLPASVYVEVMKEFDTSPFSMLTAVAAADAEPALALLREKIIEAQLSAAVRSELRRWVGRSALAVRSSAIAEDGTRASFAGVHRSFLGICGVDAVERAVLGCFASLWTPQALAYRRRMNVSEGDVRCAVVLCEMVDAKTAGVAFSCDPRTGRNGRVVIEAAPGLGDKVVSGEVNPDHIELELRQDELVRATPGRSVLTPEQEIELAYHVLRIHWALGDGQDPQDVEWAHDGTRFWFLQARPVTALPRFTFEGVRHLPVIWSTANIKEAIPGVVSVLSWSLIQEVMQAALYAGPVAVGYPIPAGLQAVRRFAGRAHLDLTAMQWCFWDVIGIEPARLATSIGGHQPAISVPSPTAKDRRRHRKYLRRFFWMMLGFPRRLRKALDKQFLLTRALTSARPPRTREALLQGFRRIAAAQARFCTPLGLANGYASTLHDILRERLRRIRGEHLLSRLLAGNGTVTSAEQGYRIGDLARAARREPGALDRWQDLPPNSRFRRELERFLRDFGHRAVYEAEVMNPRWADDPTYIIEQVRCHLGVQGNSRDAARRIRDEALAELRRLTFWRRPILRWLLKKAAYGFSAREAAKSGMSAPMWAMRHLALEVGRCLGLEHPELAFHLSKADHLAFLLGFWDGRGAAELALDREAQREAWLRLPEPPDCIIEGASRVIAPVPVAFDGTRWKGIGAASGRAAGTARIVRQPAEGARLHAGEILAAPSTDPGWTPLFVRAKALVMETGGYLSHGAIVAREYGLPAVVNVPGLLDQLRDGESVEVDGDSGEVKRAS